MQLEFQTQIKRLRAKLEQIGGLECLVQFDDDTLAKLQFEVDRPADDGCMHIVSRMNNEQLAHELLFDNAFQVILSNVVLMYLY